MTYPKLTQEEIEIFHETLRFPDADPAFLASVFLTPLDTEDENLHILEKIGAYAVKLAFEPGNAEDFQESILRKFHSLVGTERVLDLDDLVTEARIRG